jgi:ABC-type Fe3+/spermidine/putrescine transport system ATPase subunit
MSGVQLENISKAYGATVAVDDVSFEVPEGEFCSMLGPSGCGKTTLLRMLAGLLEPDHGAVRIGGTDMRGVPPFSRDIGLVFQQGALFPHRTVGQNVAFGLKMRGVGRRERDARASRALELVRLTGMESRRVHQLSGGQQQRVALARALAIEPKVLLLDEPFSALDRQLRVELRRDLLELQRELGITTVAVTHDQIEALSMSDRVVVMRRGRVEQIGSPADIYLRPETLFAAEFMGENNVLRGRAIEVTRTGAVVETEGGMRVVAVGDPVSTGDDVLVVLRADKLVMDRPTDESLDNGAKGTIYLVSFMGELVRYYVDLGAIRVFVDSPSREEEKLFHEGEQVRIVPPGEGGYLFPHPS